MPNTSSPNDTLQITNNTAVPIAVLDSTGTQSGADSPVQVTNKMLPTTDGKASIANGTTASVALNDTYIDSGGKTQPALLYHLIFCTTDWLTPIKTLGVMQNLISGAYDPTTVAPNDLTAMTNAINFYYMIALYPSSKVAQEYSAALSSDVSVLDPGQTPQDAASKVNAYLKSTKNYSNVTFDMIVAVQTYLSSYPFAWARKQPSMTYYLYSTDGSGASGSSMQLQGTIKLESSSSVPDAASSNGGYTVIWTDSNNKSTPLTYISGQFVDDPGSDFPGVALQGSFVLKSRLTGKASDNSLISILNGTINGTNVLGLDTRQDAPGSGQRGFWQTMFEPQSAQEVFNSIMQIGGFLMLLHFVGSTLWSGIQKLRGKSAGEPLTKQDLEKIQQDMESRYQEQMKQLTRDPEPANTNLAEVQTDANTAISDQVNAASKTAVEVQVDAESARLQTLAENATAITPEMETAATNLRTVSDTLKNASFDPGLSATVEHQAQMVKDISTDITTIQNDVFNEVSTEIQQTIKQNQQVSEEAATDEQALEEDSANIEDGSLSDDVKIPEDF